MIRPRVLLADDHPALLEATTALLKRQFEVVGTAVDGASLVSEALRLRPDVIVSDITMPVMSGIDAVHELRELALFSQSCVLDDPFRGTVCGGMPGGRRTGICCEATHEGPLDLRDTSCPSRRILHFFICLSDVGGPENVIVRALCKRMGVENDGARPSIVSLFVSGNRLRLEIRKPSQSFG